MSLKWLSGALAAMTLAASAVPSQLSRLCPRGLPSRAPSRTFSTRRGAVIIGMATSITITAIGGTAISGPAIAITAVGGTRGLPSDPAS